MATKNISQSWYRVAGLRPRLAAQAAIHRQVYRGQVWHLLQDVSTQNFYRLGPSSYRFVGLLDGRRTVHEIWHILNEQLGDDAPTQDEVIRLLSQLHTGNVLLSDFPPDVEEMFKRHQKLRSAKVKKYLLNPLFARIPLFDPDRFLKRWAPHVKPLFSWWGAVVWLAVVGSAVLAALAHWTELTSEITDLILAPDNLLYLYLSFAVIKGVHEFGHGFACRVQGGEVHEMGIMFLVFTPVPYVETSSSWAFPSKQARLLVSSAGMLAELFVAAIAVFVWINVEPGLVRSLAYNAIFLASVTTVLFNGNPLLRYDGYYILSDVLEMPNLRKRASDYLKYLIERYLFGLKTAVSMPDTASEIFWLLFYGIGSFVYRIFISIAIILFVADMFFFIGVLMAAMVTITWGIVPLFKAGTYVLTSPKLAEVRSRAVFVTGVFLALVLIPLSFLPVPFASRSEGVIFLPEYTAVRAKSPGFVERVEATPGERVRAGSILIVCRNPDLENALERVKLRIDETEGRYHKSLGEDRVEAENFRRQIEFLRSLEADLQVRVGDLSIRSPADGVFVLARADDLPGRYLEEGSPAGRVVDPASMVVRTVVAQTEIDLVRTRLRSVEVRFAERVGDVFTAQVEREVPSGQQYLPSPALGIMGGGSAAVDPSDPSLSRALEAYFILDLRLTGDRLPRHIGERAFVRFDLGNEPLLGQLSRRLRQLLLDRFEF